MAIVSACAIKAFTIISLICPSVSAGTYNDTSTLLSDIMIGYNKHVRPIENQNDALHVNVTFDLAAIIEFDEVNGKLTLGASLSFVWIDSKLQWQPLLYNHTYVANVPLSSIWAPDLTLSSAATTVESLASSSSWMSVTAVYNGIVYFTATDKFQVFCTINIKYYPFDSHNCAVLFMSSKYTTAHQWLHNVYDKAQLRYYHKHGEWEIVDTYCQEGQGDISIIQINVVLKRRPTFIVINILIPMIILSVLNLFVFIIPADSGERVSFAVTILLAITVFLTIVSANIPKTSTPLSHLCYFIGLQVGLSSIICILTIINLHFFHKEDSALVPKWISYLLCDLKMHKVNPESALPSVRAPALTILDQNDERNDEFSKSNDFTKKTVCEENAKGCEDVTHNMVTWKQVCAVIDKTMFIATIVCFLVGFIVFTFIFALQDEPKDYSYDFINFRNKI